MQLPHPHHKSWIWKKFVPLYKSADRHTGNRHNHLGVSVETTHSLAKNCEAHFIARTVGQEHFGYEDCTCFDLSPTAIKSLFIGFVYQSFYRNEMLHTSDLETVVRLHHPAAVYDYDKGKATFVLVNKDEPDRVYLALHRKQHDRKDETYKPLYMCAARFGEDKVFGLSEYDGNARGNEYYMYLDLGRVEKFKPVYIYIDDRGTEILRVDVQEDYIAGHKAFTVSWQEVEAKDAPEHLQGVVVKKQRVQDEVAKLF